MMRSTHLHTLKILIIVLILLIVPLVSAQGTGLLFEVELVGIIEGLTFDTITVNQRVIDITAAELNIPLGLGTPVKIEGSLLTDGTIVAREVDDTLDGVQPGEIELEGILQSATGNDIVVNNLTIDTTNAEIEAGSAVGSTVKVHARFDSNGNLNAREVEPLLGQNDDDTQNEDDELEITGTLEQIGLDFIVISGQRIDITNAEIKDPLLPGVLVKVHVSEVNGQLVARETENARTQAPVVDGNNGNANANDNTNQNANVNLNANTNDNLSIASNGCVVSPPAGWVAVTVQSGDTLLAISNRTGTSLSALGAVNCISNPSVIITGATIFVARPPVADVLSNQNANNNTNANLNDNINDTANQNANTNTNANVNDNGNSNLNVNNNQNANANVNDNNNFGDDDDDDNSGSGNSGSGNNDDDDDDDDDNSGSGNSGSGNNDDDNSGSSGNSGSGNNNDDDDDDDDRDRNRERDDDDDGDDDDRDRNRGRGGGDDDDDDRDRNRGRGGGDNDDDD